MACVCMLAVVCGQTAGNASQRIIGGHDTDITQVPWQVFIAYSDSFGVSLCGGSLLDSTHVVTAEHCLRSDPTDEAHPASTSTLLQPDVAGDSSHSWQVIAGSTRIRQGDVDPVEGKISGVSAITADPGYDDALNHDVGVITLSTPIPLDGTHRQAVTLGSVLPPTGAPLTVSGWGVTDEHGQQVNNTLQSTTVNVTDFNACNAVYGGFIAGMEICANAPGHDSCSGDSGGPLTDATAQLVGIVSSGQGCGHIEFPGIYSSVANCQIRTFITSVTGPASGCNGPSLTGTAREGQALHCSPGDWTGTPTFSYAFVSDAATGSPLQSGSSDSYTLTGSDVGHSVSCRVTATSATGRSLVGSNATGIVAHADGSPGTPPVTTPQPVTTTTAPPVTTTATTPVVTPAQADTTPPRTKVLSTRCSPTQCVLHIGATDPGFSTGIATVRGTVRTTVTRNCVKKGRKARCSRTITTKLSGKLTRAGYFTVVASKLPTGLHRFSFIAVDKAGNIERSPTSARASTHARR